MPRRLKVRTRELGDLEVFALYDSRGSWGRGEHAIGASTEFAWDTLKGTGVDNLLSVVSEEVFNHALHGWSRPLVDALGLPPEGSLHKMPKEMRPCFRRVRCPSHDPVRCVPTHPDMPWCYEPDVSDAERRAAVSEAVRLWRDSVYILVIT